MMKPTSLLPSVALALAACTPRAPSSAPPDPPAQTFAAGLSAVCAGATPTHPEALALATLLDDPRRAKSHRLIALRDAADRAGIAPCARLDAMTAFDPPPAPTYAIPTTVDAPE